MLKIKKRTDVLAMCLCFVLSFLALPASSTELVYPDIHVQLHELDGTHLRIGQQLPVGTLEKVKVGLPVQELEALLGRPFRLTHRDEYLDFDYNITLHIAGGTSEVVCQFKVLASTEGLVSSTHWRRDFCKNLYQAELKKAATVSAPAAVPAVLPKEVETISADLAFTFAQAELTPQGQARLDAIVARLLGGSTKPKVLIVGHADRIGTPARKFELSERRAEAVRSYLASKGFPQELMQVESRGDSEPIVVCDKEDVQELKDCLQPNRRVEIKTLE